MDLLESLIALSRLKDLPRTGWIQAGVPHPESVAGHVLGIGYLALALGPKHSQSLLMDRVLGMALLHDAPEASSGDLPRKASQALPKGAKAAMEAELGKELLEPFPAASRELLAEFAAQETSEARFVKACDRMQLAVQGLALLQSGQRGLQEFALGLEREDWSEHPDLGILWRRIRKQWHALEKPEGDLFEGSTPGSDVP